MRLLAFLPLHSLFQGVKESWSLSLGPQTLKNLEVSGGADGSGSSLAQLLLSMRSQAVIGTAVRRTDAGWLMRGEAEHGAGGRQ